MIITSTRPSLYPEFDRNEIRRLPHLAIDRILSRLEDCRTSFSRQGQDRQGALDEAVRLIGLFPVVGEFISGFRQRSEIVSHMVFWESWVRSKGNDTEIDKLRPYTVESGANVNRKPYATITEQSVEGVLNDLISGNHVRALLFEKIDFSRRDPEQVSGAFREGRIVDCEFRECNFRFVEIPDARLVRVELNRCELQGTDMRNLKAHDIRISNPKSMKGARFTDAVFFAVRFDFEDLDRIITGRSLMTKEIDFSQAVFADCWFQKMKFESSNFSSALLVHCIIEDSYFDGCDLQGTVFHDTKLASCEFAGGSLANAIFNECNMAGIELKEGSKVSRARGREFPILRQIDCKTSFDLPGALWEQLPDADRAAMSSWHPSDDADSLEVSETVDELLYQSKN